MGVPLFQEQAMQIAIIGAGFSPDEADAMRRALATFRHNGSISALRDLFLEGMQKNSYSSDFSVRCFKQIEGFGTYGFPEAHAISFANLVYVSAWLKCHYPDVFCAALLNSQPMGFYAPAQLVRDARDNHVEVRPIDVNHSYWESTLEPLPSPDREGAVVFALRLGLQMVSGLPEKDALALVDARGAGYRTPVEIARRAQAAAAARSIVLRRQMPWHP
jgi:error-prone DNA polymerase